MFVHTGEWILVGRRDLPFSVPAEQRHFKGLGLSLAFFPLPMLLSFSSFQIFALVFLDATFLAVQIWSHPLLPFFSLGSSIVLMRNFELFFLLSKCFPYV